MVAPPPIQRLRHQYADLQLHGGGRPEHLDLTATAVNLNGATITDGAGNAANLSLAGLTQGSPQIDTTAPTVSRWRSLAASGDLDAGKTVTLTLNMSEAVTVGGRHARR